MRLWRAVLLQEAEVGELTRLELGHFRGLLADAQEHQRVMDVLAADDVGVVGLCAHREFGPEV